MIAVQGPRAIELLDLVSDAKISTYPRFSSGRAKVLGVPCLVGRTGYTGEDGVELFFPAESAEKAMDRPHRRRRQARHRDEGDRPGCPRQPPLRGGHAAPRP